MERRGTLLLVEDEAVLRGLVSQFLRNEGYEVAEAEDGGEGVRRHQEDGPFDLLLVDLNLPVFSGVEVCRRVKLHCPSQKIMICSAAIVLEHEEALIALGVAHFLTKPYHPENLLAHIRQEIDGPPPRPPSPSPLLVPRQVRRG
jgi:DNA-binding response OmpR family regulator